MIELIDPSIIALGDAWESLTGVKCDPQWLSRGYIAMSSWPYGEIGTSILRGDKFPNIHRFLISWEWIRGLQYVKVRKVKA